MVLTGCRVATRLAHRCGRSEDGGMEIMEIIQPHFTRLGRLHTRYYKYLHNPVSSCIFGTSAYVHCIVWWKVPRMDGGSQAKGKRG